jgi:hypothetical protein
MLAGLLALLLAGCAHAPATSIPPTPLLRLEVALELH